MLQINDFPVLPKQYRVVQVNGEDWIAAMMPYPVTQPEDASCSGDPRWTQDLPAGSGGRNEANRMRAVCHACPLLVACREWGIAHEKEWGVFGGLTVDERAAIRKERKQIGFDPSAAHEYDMGDDYWNSRYINGLDETEDEWANA